MHHGIRGLYKPVKLSLFSRKPFNNGSIAHLDLIRKLAAFVILVNVNECRRHEFRLTAYTAEQIFKPAIKFDREYKLPDALF